MSIITVKNLCKTFKKPIRGEGLKGMIKTLFSRKYEPIHAVKDINFDIQQGEIVGYIGANGAGKSTTIKMMCGILYPTAGEVIVDGMNFNKNRKEINKQMGVVFGQKTQLWWDIPLIETFKILKVIYDISDEAYGERFNYLCDLLDLKQFLSQSVRSLSLGQRMRADFAAALIHSPKIVYLDDDKNTTTTKDKYVKYEPSNGESKQTIELLLIDGHYCLNEKIPVSKFFIEHYDEINGLHIINLSYLQKISRYDKKEKKYVSGRACG